jgi:glutamate-1-semialdehyde aminotransferase
MARIQAAIDATNVGARLTGNGWMFFITFDRDPGRKYKDRRVRFYTHAIREGIFIQPYHHGYVAYRHTDADLDRTVDVVTAALNALE